MTLSLIGKILWRFVSVFLIAVSVISFLTGEAATGILSFAFALYIGYYKWFDKP